VRLGRLHGPLQSQEAPWTGQLIGVEPDMVVAEQLVTLGRTRQAREPAAITPKPMAEKALEASAASESARKNTQATTTQNCGIDDGVARTRQNRQALLQFDPAVVRIHELAAALGVPSFTVDPTQFTSNDGGGHLDARGARKYSTMFFAWLEQQPEFQRLFSK
jgi:hypothetical protein